MDKEAILILSHLDRMEPEKQEVLRRELRKRKLFWPSKDFCRWWEPDGINSVSGAETGGHPEALRKCVQPETGEARWYGINSINAFNCERYRKEFVQWIKDGFPEREFVYDGTAAPRDKTLEELRKIKQILASSDSLVQKIDPATPEELALEKMRMGLEIGQA
jgi:hypothetical protein